MYIIAAIKRYLQEKNAELLAQQQAQIDYQVQLNLQRFKKVMIDALYDFPKLYNVKQSLSKVSIKTELVQNNVVKLSIPKELATTQLRSLQCIEFKQELAERLQHLRAEAELTWQEFLRTYEEEHRELSMEAYSLQSDVKLREFERNKKLDKIALEQNIGARFWQYEIQRVTDSVDSLYIDVYVAVCITG